MDLNPFLTLYIDAMLNVDTNVNVKFKHTISDNNFYLIIFVSSWILNVCLKL